MLRQSSSGKVLSGWEKMFPGISQQNFPGGGQVHSEVREGAIEILGPRHLSNVRAAVGGQGKSHTKVCFIETGGANKAPLLQGADSQHKFPFTPTVHELTPRGGFRRGFSANYPVDRGLLHLEPNEGIM